MKALCDSFVCLFVCFIFSTLYFSFGGIFRNLIELGTEDLTSMNHIILEVVAVFALLTILQPSVILSK